jgi:hypothetical protein
MTAVADLVDAIATKRERQVAERYAAETAAINARLAYHVAVLARQEAQQRRYAVGAGVVVAVILGLAAWWAVAAVWP